MKARRALVALACIAGTAAACSGAEEPLPADPPDEDPPKDSGLADRTEAFDAADASADAELPNVELGPAELRAAIDDVTGDGAAEAVYVRTGTPSGGAVEIWSSPLPGSLITSLSLPRHATASLVSFATGDLNADGARDLVLGLPWTSQVAVFYGPLVQEPRSWESADVHLDVLPAGGPDGLTNRFGYSLWVDDLTGAGVDDLAVGAPAEGEEACHGTEPTRIYAGPLAAQPTPSLAFDSGEADCTGQWIRRGALPSGPPVLWLGGQNSVRWFLLPLAGEMRPAGRLEGYELLDVGDYDVDGELDGFNGHSIRYGNGTFTYPPSWQELALRGPYDSSWLGVRPTDAGADLYLLDLAQPDAPLHLLLRTESPYFGGDAPATQADLDGDGRMDWVIHGHVVPAP